MSDYVNCPTCHGRGVIPLETAHVIEAHDDANAELESAERHKAEDDQRRAEINAEIRYRLEIRRERHERQLRSASSGLEQTPEQLAVFKARLAALEAGQAGTMTTLQTDRAPPAPLPVGAPADDQGCRAVIQPRA